MRTTKLLITLTLASLAALTIGCGKQEGNSGSGIAYQPYGPYIPGPGTVGPGTNPGTYDGINWEYGGTANLTVTAAALSSYVGYNVSNASNVRINLNLSALFGTATADSYHSVKGEKFEGYGGVVTIGFDQGTGRYEDRFSSLVNPNGMVKTDAENNKYNKWRQGDGKWRGFFQDYYGAIVVVIDDIQDFGDGSNYTVGGEVWFKNHPVGINLGPLSPTSCWFVVTGPYDCRTQKVGKKVDTEGSLYPNGADGYVKLGRFSNLDLNTSFNSTPLAP
ncbi:MAG: hypothetical protein AABZ31_10075 [Bdellovibrionota bacterium]